MLFMWRKKDNNNNNSFQICARFLFRRVVCHSCFFIRIFFDFNDEMCSLIIYIDNKGCRSRYKYCILRIIIAFLRYFGIYLNTPCDLTMWDSSLPSILHGFIFSSFFWKIWWVRLKSNYWIATFSSQTGYRPLLCHFIFHVAEVPFFKMSLERSIIQKSRMLFIFRYPRLISLRKTIKLGIYSSLQGPLYQ